MSILENSMNRNRNFENLLLILNNFLYHLLNYCLSTLNPTFCSPLCEAGMWITTLFLLLWATCLALPLEGTREWAEGWKRMKGLAPSYFSLSLPFCLLFSCTLETLFHPAVVDHSGSSSWFQFAVFPVLTELIPVCLFSDTSTVGWNIILKGLSASFTGKSSKLRDETPAQPVRLHHSLWGTSFKLLNFNHLNQLIVFLQPKGRLLPDGEEMGKRGG